MPQCCVFKCNGLSVCLCTVSLSVMALSVCCGNCLDCWFYKSPYFASLPMSLPGTKSDWSYGNYLVCWFYKSPYFASLPMSLPGTKSDWSCGSCLVCWFYKSPYFDKSSCVIDRHEERLELRHTLEGHQLGVVSVDINSTGNCILFLAHFGSDWSSLGHSALTSSPQPTASSDLNIMSWERLLTRLYTVIMFVIQ